MHLFMKLKCNILYLSVLFAGLLVIHPSKAQQITRKVKETLLLKIYDTALVNNSFTFSKDLKKVACCIRDGKKQRVVINGSKGKLYDSVHLPVFSPDGNAFIYQALEGTRWLWITSDNRELSVAPDETISFARFSPDSKSIAYVVTKDHKFRMVFKGIKGKPYDVIDYNSIAFSKDGQKLLYTATLNKKQFNVTGLLESTHFDKVGFPVLSADGNRLAFWAINNKKSFAVVDNKTGRAFDEVSSIIFSENGKHYAYHAMIANKHVVVLDTSVGEKYVFVHSICFSPDGLKLAYGLESTPDPKEGFKHYMSLAGKTSQVYETVVEGSFRFSPDSKSLLFEAEIHDAFFIVNNGREGKRHSDVLQSTTIFSPDNLRIDYAVEDYSKRFVVADDIEGLPYQDILHIAFSPNSRQLVYSARLNNKELVVVDGINGRMYDTLQGLGEIIFDTPDSFHYMARKGNDIFLVEEKIELPK